MNIIGNAPTISAYGFEFGAITTVDINSQKVFRDVVFSWAKRFSLAASGTVDIVINPIGVLNDKLLVVLPISFTAIGAGPVNVDLYAGVDSDEDGTLWAGGNRDFRSSTQPDTTVRLGPTINDVGTKSPFEFLIPSDGVPATATVGGQTKDDLIFIARTDIKYMFRLVNTEANVANCAFALSVFEVSEG